MDHISLDVIKMASKKARLSETERFIELWLEEESLWNILSIFILDVRQGSEYASESSTISKPLIIMLKTVFR